MLVDDADDAELVVVEIELDPVVVVALLALDALLALVALLVTLEVLVWPWKFCRVVDPLCT